MIAITKRTVITVLMIVGLMASVNGYADEQNKAIGIFYAWTGLSAVSGLAKASFKWGNWSGYNPTKMARISRYAGRTSAVASLPLVSVIAGCFVKASGSALDLDNAVCKVIIKPCEYMVITPAVMLQNIENNYFKNEENKN